MNKTEMTREWWRAVLKDDERLAKWLQKLQLTEIGGHNDHLKFLILTEVEHRTKSILLNIAMDEYRHSSALIDLLDERGIPLKSRGDAEMSSLYWDFMNSHVKSVHDYCAVNYFGESLAADRFSIIHEMPETPSDIKEFIALALPDEIFHRETLLRLAGEEAIAKFLPLHQQIFSKLTEKR